MRRYDFYKPVFEIHISFYPLKIMVTKGNSYKSKFGTHYYTGLSFDYIKNSTNYPIDFIWLKSKVRKIIKAIAHKT